MFLKAIARAPGDEDVSVRVLSLTEAITHSALQYTCQGLFQRDRLTFLTHTALQVSGTGRRQNRNTSHPPTTTSSLPPPALCHSHQSLHFSALTLSSIRLCQWSRVRSYWLTLTARAPLSLNWSALTGGWAAVAECKYLSGQHLFSLLLSVSTACPSHVHIKQSKAVLRSACPSLMDGDICIQQTWGLMSSLLCTSGVLFRFFWRGASLRLRTWNFCCDFLQRFVRAVPSASCLHRPGVPLG